MGTVRHRSWFAVAADWYWAQFVCAFCYHLPLPLMLVAVLALLLGRVGSEFGVGHLIYHDDPAKRFVVGFAFGCVVLHTLFAGFLLAGEQRAGEDPPPGRGPFPRYAVGILACLLGTLAAITGAVGAVRAAGVLVRTGTIDLSAVLPGWPGTEWLILAAGMAAAAVAAAALGALTRWVGRSRAWLTVLHLWQRRQSLATPLRPLDRGWLFLPLGYAYAAFLFIAWVYFRLDDPWLRLAAVLGTTVGLPGVFAALFPTRAERFAEVFWKNLNAPTVSELLYHIAAAVFLVVGVIVLYLLADSTAVGSPAVAVSVPLFVSVAVYGFVRYVIRYRSAAVSVFVLAAAVVGGASPYKFRFPDLDADRDRADAKLKDGFYTGRAGATDLLALAGQPPADRAAGIDPSLPLDLAKQLEHDIAAHTAYLTVIETARTDPRFKPRYDKYLDNLAALRRREPTTPHLDDDWRKQWNLLNAERLAIEDAAAGGKEPMDALRWAFAHTRVLPGKDLRPETQYRPAGADKDGDTSALLDIYAVKHHGEGKTAVEVAQNKPEIARRVEPTIVKKPLILIAVSGGGLRSAAWTLAVLQELERKFAAAGIDFPAHVRLVSGASGGMLGAAHYVATLAPAADRATVPDRNALPAGRPDDLTADYTALTSDFLTPLVHRSVFNDLPAVLSPFPVVRDRGRTLEQAWAGKLNRFDRTWLAGTDWAKARVPADGVLDVPFAELRKAEARADIPSLVFAPMLVEDGRRLLVSNLDLKAVASNDGTRLTGGESLIGDGTLARNFSHDALELFRMFPSAAATVRLGTAVRMSASFPYFSPAAVLPTAPRRRVVDAGYYDNYGVNVAAAWLFSSSNRQWLRQHVSKVLLVQVRDGASDDDRRLRAVPGEGSTVLSRAGEELTTPPVGLYNARVGSASFRNDGLLELLSSFLQSQEEEFGVARAKGQTAPPDPFHPRRHANRFFTTALFEFPGEASLSWYLTDQEKGAFLKAATDPPAQKTIDAILEWWKVSLESN